MRQLMWNYVGIIRCKESLSIARKWLNKKAAITEGMYHTQREFEMKNMLTVSNLITDASLLREGSVGAHYRSDFKQRGEDWERHLVCRKGKTPSRICHNNPKQHYVKP